MQKHSETLNKLLTHLRKNFKGRFFRREIGKVKISDRWITYGITGQADIYGWIDVASRPIHLEIELKMPGDSLKLRQRWWKKVCEEHGVIYAVCKGEDFETLTERIKEQVKRMA